MQISCLKKFSRIKPNKNSFRMNLCFFNIYVYASYLDTFMPINQLIKKTCSQTKPRHNIPPNFFLQANKTQPIDAGQRPKYWFVKCFREKKLF